MYDDVPVEHTTQLPIPIGASTCNHTWEKATEQFIETTHEKKQVLVLVCTLCGLVDKTIESSVCYCRHKWKRTVHVTPSAWEISKAHARYRDANNCSPWELHQKTVIIDVCEYCGERHEIVSENFDLEIAEKKEIERAEIKRAEAEAKKAEREAKREESSNLRKAKEAEAEAKKAEVEANEQQLIILHTQAKMKGINIVEKPRRSKR